MCISSNIPSCTRKCSHTHNTHTITHTITQTHQHTHHHTNAPTHTCAQNTTPDRQHTCKAICSSRLPAPPNPSAFPSCLFPSAGPCCCCCCCCCMPSAETWELAAISRASCSQCVGLRGVLFVLCIFVCVNECV